MKKVEQKNINTVIEREYDKAMEEYIALYDKRTVKQLRSCSAEVITTDNYYYLRSYNTIVAIINRETGELFDVLRFVYGYTSTSAQHISKFSHDYGAYDGRKWGCEVIYRWYRV